MIIMTINYLQVELVNSSKVLDSFRAWHRENWQGVRMILYTQFDHIVERFSPHLWKQVGLLMKTLNKPLSKAFSLNHSLHPAEKLGHICNQWQKCALILFKHSLSFNSPVALIFSDTITNLIIFWVNCINSRPSHPQHQEPIKHPEPS